VEGLWISESKLKEKYPNIKTTLKALWSPSTATVDPKEICLNLSSYVQKMGINLLTNQGEIKYKKLINCAGLYADKIAKDFGFAKNYTIIPFKGIYLKDKNNIANLKTNAYPVPNLKRRENYRGFDNFSFSEMINILYYESKLFLKNAFGFRSLAYNKTNKRAV